MPLPLDLLTWLPRHGPPFLLVASRATGLAWTAPGWGLNLPGLGWRIRLALGLSLAAVLAPTLGPRLGAPSPDSGWLPLIGNAILEAAVGVALGLGASLVIAAARQAGEIVGAQAGLSPASLLDPEGKPAVDGELTALGTLYGLVALAIFLALDGPLRLVDALAESYDALPAALGGRPPSPEQALEAFAGVGWALSLAVRLAAPAGLALVLAGLALAWLARSGPPTPLANLAWPARSVLGVTLAWLGLVGLATTLVSAWNL
jgi:flagellar biosynthetic protein FliR